MVILSGIRREFTPQGAPGQVPKGEVGGPTPKMSVGVIAVVISSNHCGAKG